MSKANIPEREQTTAKTDLTKSITDQEYVSDEGNLKVNLNDSQGNLKVNESELKEISEAAEVFAVSTGYTSTYDRARLAEGFESGYMAALAAAQSPSSSFDESWVRNEAQNFWPTLDEYDTVMNREAVDLAVEIAERWHKHALAKAESPPPTTPSISARTREDIRYAKEIWKELALKPMCKDQDCNSYSEFSRVLGHLIAGLEYPDLCDHPTVTLTAPAESPSIAPSESELIQKLMPLIHKAMARSDRHMPTEFEEGQGVMAEMIFQALERHSLESPSTAPDEDWIQMKTKDLFDHIDDAIDANGAFKRTADWLREIVRETKPKAESPQPTTPSSSDVPTTMGEEMLRLELATAYQTLNFMIKTGLDVTPSQLKPICGSAKEVLLTWSKTKALQLTAESESTTPWERERKSTMELLALVCADSVRIYDLELELGNRTYELSSANERIAELEAQVYLQESRTKYLETKVAELELEVKEACAGRDQWRATHLKVADLEGQLVDERKWFENWKAANKELDDARKRIAELERDNKKMFVALANDGRFDEDLERIAELEAERDSLQDARNTANQEWNAQTDRIAELELKEQNLIKNWAEAGAVIKELEAQITELKRKNKHVKSLYQNLQSKTTNLKDENERLKLHDISGYQQMQVEMTRKIGELEGELKTLKLQS